MTRDDILRLLKQSGEPLKVKCWLRYDFDFACTPLVIDKREFYQIGANELDMPIVVDPGSGEINLVVPHRLCLINSSFPQLLKAFAFGNAWPIPDDLPDNQRASLFRQGLLEIDSECLKEANDANRFWPGCVEDIEQGVV